MKSTDRTFRQISFFTGLSYGVVLPVLFVFLKGKGISNIDLAVLALTSTVTTMLLELPSGNIADRYGRKLTFLIGQIPFLLFCVGITYSTSFAGLAVSMFMSGAATASVSGTLDSIYVQQYNQATQSSSLQSKLATLTLYSMLGTLTGALFGIALGLLVEFGSSPMYAILQDRIFLFMGGVALFLAIFVSIKIKEPEKISTSQSKVRGLNHLKEVFKQSTKMFFQSKQLLVISSSSMIAAAAYMCFEKFWQIQLANLTGNTVSKSIFYYFFCGGLGISILGQYLSIKLCAYFKENLIYPVLATRGVLIVAFLLLSHTFDMTFFAICYALIYLASSCSASPVMALFHSYVIDEFRTSLLSIRSITIQLGATIGILQAGIISNYISINAAFLSSALLYVASTAVILATMNWFNSIHNMKNKNE